MERVARLGQYLSDAFKTLGYRAGGRADKLD